MGLARGELSLRRIRVLLSGLRSRSTEDSGNAGAHLARAAPRIEFPEDGSRVGARLWEGDSPQRR